jgi:hypothetical protein
MNGKKNSLSLRVQLLTLTAFHHQMLNVGSYRERQAWSAQRKLKSYLLTTYASVSGSPYRCFNLGNDFYNVTVFVNID